MLISSDDGPLPKRIWRPLKKLNLQKTKGYLEYSSAGTIIALAFLVFFGNILSRLDNTNDLFLDLSTENTQAIVSDISKYTPIVEEDLDHLQNVLNGEQEEFLQKPSLAISMKDPIRYTVEKGDSISNIARKFSTSVATIMDENGLTVQDLDLIKPGKELIIPPYTTNESLAWLDEVNKIEEEKRKKAEAEREAQRLKLQLALGKNRNLAYRETSSGRAIESTGTKGFAIPINSNGISRGISYGHTGIDYRANVGTPVIAGKSGKVIDVTRGWAGGWGISVVVDHGGGLTSRYAHLSSSAVSVGSNVSQGNVVGYSGNTGFSTGPHLHFETRLNGRVVSPY